MLVIQIVIIIDHQTDLIHNWENKSTARIGHNRISAKRIAMALY